MKKHPLDQILFFKAARLVSYLSVGGHYASKRMGAVLFKGKSQLGYGFNILNKTHPLHKKAITSIHAEINCLLKRRHYDDISDCSIVVYREDGNGEPALAKPCDNCQMVMKEYGIKKVYYSIPLSPYYEVMKL